MAVVSNPTDLTALDDIIDSEFISRNVRLAVRTPMTFAGVVKLIDFTQVSSRDYAVPKSSELTAAATLTETDEVDSEAISLSEATIATALVQRSTFLSDQARGASIWDAAAISITEVVNAVRRTLDNDTHALSNSMSNSIGNNAQAMDFQNWSAVVAAFRAQAKFSNGPVAAVMHPAAIRDLHSDLLANSAGVYGSAFGPEARAVLEGVNQGARGLLEDVILWESDAVPAADTTGVGNYMTVTGPAEGALCLVANREVGVELWREPKRQGTWYIGTADFGVGIADQDRCLQFITQP